MNGNGGDDFIFARTISGKFYGGEGYYTLSYKVSALGVTVDVAAGIVTARVGRNVTAGIGRDAGTGYTN